MPEHMLVKIAEMCGDSEWSVRLKALRTLRFVSNLPPAGIKFFTKRLRSDDSSVQSEALEFLGNQDALDEETVHLIATYLHHPSRLRRKDAVVALEKQSPLPLAIIAQIENQLTGSCDDNMELTARSEVQYHKFPEVIVGSIIRQLGDATDSLQTAISKTLSQKSDLSNNVVDTINQRLRLVDVDVRLLALRGLQNKASLPQKLFTAIMAEVRDGDHNIRTTAIKCLEKNFDIPETAVQELSLLLNESESEVQESILAILDNKILPEANIKELLQLFAKSETQIQKAILKTIRGRKLGEEVKDEIAERLKTLQPSLRQSALRILSGQPTLSEAALAAIVEEINSHDESHYYTKLILEKNPSLPEAAIRSFAAQVTSQTGRDGLQRPAPSVGLVAGRQQRIFNFLLEQGFMHNLVFYARDNCIWVNDARGQRKVEVDMDSKTLQAVVKCFKDSRPEDCPAVSNCSP